MDGLLGEVCIHWLTKGEAIFGLIKYLEMCVFSDKAKHTEGVKRNDEIVILSAQGSWLTGLILKLETVGFRDGTQTGK